MVRAGAAEDYAAFVASDWADKKHVWACQKADSSDHQQGEMEASPEAVDAWVSELLVRFPGRRIAVAREQKRGALLYLLSKYAALVLYPVHPATVSRMRSALYPSHRKDDPKDAHLLLDLLVYHRQRLRRLEANTVETRQLQSAGGGSAQAGGRKDPVQQPATSEAEAVLSAGSALVAGVALEPGGRFSPALADFAAAAQKARPGTIRQFLQQHNCRSQESIQRRLEEIPQPTVATTDVAVVDASVAMVRALVALLGTLRTHIAELDQQIAATAAVHPALPILDSLPGVGPVMVPRLLAAMGTQRERFAGASELSTMTGIAPVKQESGQSQWIHFRWKCPKFLRQTFHEWAGHSIAQSKWAKAYYEDQIRKHKKHHAAVRALAFKWQRILFRCWKDHQPYHEQKYLQALRRRGSPLAQALS